MNIFFPFIDEQWFDDIAKYIGGIIRRNGIRSFEVKLAEFDVWDRVKSGLVTGMQTVFLKPSGCDTEMQELWDCLKGEWPICAGKHGDSEFHPHLTCGKYSVTALMDQSYAHPRGLLGTMNSQWKEKGSLSFECNELCLISRRGNDPFVVRHRIPLLPNASSFNW